MDFQWFFAHHKRLMYIPLVLLAFSLLFLGVHYAQTGDLIYKDVTLQGGLSVTINTPAEVPDLERQLGQALGTPVVVRRLAEFGTGTQLGFLIEASEVTEAQIKAPLESLLGIPITEENYSIEQTGPTLGQSFYKEMVRALFFSFLLMAIVVFVAFRSLMPSATIVFIAFSDIVITLAAINLLGMRISTAGIAALLLLIGYSVDTDVLLTTRLLKRDEGEIRHRFIEAMKTGLMMTSTTLAAVTVGYLVSTSPVLQQMFLIIFIGLIVDILTTYLLNGSVLLRYMERKRSSA